MTTVDIGHAVTEAARTINQCRSLPETLQMITEVASASLPGFDQVGISTVHGGGRVQTEAATGHLVCQLDDLQYSLNEGPCVDSLHDADVVAVPRLRHDQRWPRYVPQAVALGLRSQLAVKLYLDDAGTLGGLNLYSTISEEIDPDAESMADLFATHAAIAVGHARERHTLSQALQSRKTIGQAIGILMERYAMDEDRAFAYLVRASSSSNVKLRDVAQELVDQANTR